MIKSIYQTIQILSKTSSSANINPGNPSQRISGQRSIKENNTFTNIPVEYHMWYLFMTNETNITQSELKLQENTVQLL